MWRNHLDKELFAKVKGYSQLSGESAVQTQFREQLQFSRRGLGVQRKPQAEAASPFIQSPKIQILNEMKNPLYLKDVK